MYDKEQQQTETKNICHFQLKIAADSFCQSTNRWIDAALVWTLKAGLIDFQQNRL